MAGLSAGSVWVDVLPNTAKFSALLQAQMSGVANKAGQSFSQKLGSNLSTVGRNMTKYVTLPVVAAGAASLKMAVDFETSFTRIRANSNLTEAQITKLRGSVLDLAGKTAQSPQELGDALYFLASAGLNARQVTDTLGQAAKASAAGFGDTADIAKLTANALNAYAKSGLEASTVTDNLAAAVREGTAEPDEFASALGRILPIASKAGVSFDQVTASLASLSNIGLDVNEGVTAMRGVLGNLLSPGTQARDTLREFGLTADEVRESIEEDGILGAMRLLEKATNGDIDALRKIIPNIRALTGQFGLTGQKADKVSGAFDRVRDSTGDLDKAFETTKRTSSAYQLQQLLVDLQVTAIKLGTKALPVLRDVTKTVSDMLEGFSKLSPETQGLIVKLGLFAAAVGPLARLLSPVVRLVGALGKAFGITAAAATASAAASTAAGVAAAGASALPAAGAGGVSAARLAARLPRGIAPVAPAATAAAAGVTSVGAAFNLMLAAGGTAKGLDLLTDKLHEMGGTASHVGDAIRGGLNAVTGGGFSAFNRVLDEGIDKLKGLLGVETEDEEQKKRLAALTKDYTARIQSQSGVVTNLKARWSDLSDLEQQAVTAAIRKVTAETGNQREALTRLGGQLTKTEQRLLAQAFHSNNYAQALKILDGALDRTVGAHKGLDRGLSNTRDQVAANEGRVEAYVRDLNNIPKSKHTKVTADVSSANQTIMDFIKRISGIEVSVQVAARAGGAVATGPQGPGPGRRKHGGGWILNPTASPKDVPAVLQAGEFVVNRDQAKKYRGLLESLNAGMDYHNGGLVGKHKGADWHKTYMRFLDFVRADKGMGLTDKQVQIMKLNLFPDKAVPGANEFWGHRNKQGKDIRWEGEWFQRSVAEMVQRRGLQEWGRDVAKNWIGFGKQSGPNTARPWGPMGRPDPWGQSAYARLVNEHASNKARGFTDRQVELLKRKTGYSIGQDAVSGGEGRAFQGHINALVHKRGSFIHGMLGELLGDKELKLFRQARRDKDTFGLEKFRGHFPELWPRKHERGSFSSMHSGGLVPYRVQMHNGGLVGKPKIVYELQAIADAAAQVRASMQGSASGGSAAAWANEAMAAVPGPQSASGYRSPAANAAVGGSPTSYHMDPNNPAQDITGANLNAIYLYLKRFPTRELLWQVPDHYDHVHVAKYGYHGDVDKPTLFMAGEASRERVDITPHGQMGNRKDILEVHMSGTLKGTLKTPWGPAQIEAVMDEGFKAEGRWARARTRVG